MRNIYFSERRWLSKTLNRLCDLQSAIEPFTGSKGKFVPEQRKMLPGFSIFGGFNHSFKWVKHASSGWKSNCVHWFCKTKATYSISYMLLLPSFLCFIKLKKKCYLYHAFYSWPSSLSAAQASWKVGQPCCRTCWDSWVRLISNELDWTCAVE